MPGASVKNFSKDLADMIGDYNDKRIIAEHLSSSLLYTLSVVEKNTIGDICRAYTGDLENKRKIFLPARGTLSGEMSLPF